MSMYLLIESRDPFEAAGTGDFAALALSLAHAGHRVTFFLVENGVLVVREGSSRSPNAASRPNAGAQGSAPLPSTSLSSTWPTATRRSGTRRPA